MTILDSDVFTLLTYEHKNVTRHYQAVDEGEVLAVTAVTRAEVIRGRTDAVLKAADEQALLSEYKLETSDNQHRASGGALRCAETGREGRERTNA